MVFVQCPIMSAGPRQALILTREKYPPDMYRSYEYLWEDGVKYKRPTKLPAPEYVDALMNWAQAIIDDETMFPNRIGTSDLTWHCCMV
jgi:MOB kinase activator 1